MAKADILIRNGIVITMNENMSVFENGMVCIKDDVISYVGQEDINDVSSGKIIDAKGGIIMPGLINGHTHAGMSLFRGIADDLPLMEWLENYIFPVESHMDEDFVYTGTLLACAEMILSGTTTFCDMFHFEDQAAVAAKAAGIRCLLGEALHDYPSPNYGIPENGLTYTENLISKWAGDPLVSIAVGAHSPYMCGPGLLEHAWKLAMKYSVPFMIHVAETLSELDYVKGKYGKTPVEHLFDLGILGPHTIASHCVHLTERDMEIILQNNVKVIHNPESNMKLASGVAPIPGLIAAGVIVGIGTDGCASNNNLDLFTEMDMAAKLHKVNSLDPTVMAAETVLRMATIENAKALGLGEITGSLEVGKKADVIVIDTDRPHLIPMYNPLSHLVYSVRGNDVIHSIINGNIVMENRKLLTIDLEDIMTRSHEKAVKVKTWLK